MSGYNEIPELTLEDIDIDGWALSGSTSAHGEARLPLFCFASTTEENIQRAIDEEKWAVSPVSGAVKSGRATKARKMKIGSRGLLYCSETHPSLCPS
jgi:hypothetical protein